MFKRLQLPLLILTFIFFLLGLIFQLLSSSPVFLARLANFVKSTPFFSLITQETQIANSDALAIFPHTGLSEAQFFALLQIPDIPVLWTATQSGQTLTPLGLESTTSSKTSLSSALEFPAHTSTSFNSSPSPSLSNQNQTITTPSALQLPDLYPQTTSTLQLAQNLTAPTALAIDLDSQVPLFSYNAHDLHYPASSLKMMTALVARQIFPPDQILTLTQDDLTSSNSLGLEAGEQITVADLLQALLISSSNESAQALANHSPQGHDNFINRMNQLATYLHLTDTTFVTPEGFDEPDQKTSAHDLALLAQALLRDSYLQTIVALPTTTISTMNGKIHTLNSTNRYLLNPPQINRFQPPEQVTTLTPKFYGVKTGTTPLAGEVLISVAEIEGRHLLFVVMGSRDRYQDTKIMLEWIMNNYHWQPYGF